MAQALLNVDFGSTADFEPVALEPGIPMADRTGAHDAVMRAWFGNLAAEPSWQADNRLQFFVHDEQRARIVDVNVTPATAADLTGTLASDAAKLAERLKKASASSATERRLLALARARLSGLVEGRISADDACLFRYREGAGPWRLVWCWGYQRRDHRTATARVCNDGKCHTLYLAPLNGSVSCPACATVTAVRSGAGGKWRRRTLSAAVLLLLMSAGGVIGWALHARPQTLDNLLAWAQRSMPGASKPSVAESATRAQETNTEPDAVNSVKDERAESVRAPTEVSQDESPPMKAVPSNENSDRKSFQAADPSSGADRTSQSQKPVEERIPLPPPIAEASKSVTGDPIPTNRPKPSTAVFGDVPAAATDRPSSVAAAPTGFVSAAPATTVVSPGFGTSASLVPGEHRIAAGPIVGDGLVYRDGRLVMDAVPAHFGRAHRQLLPGTILTGVNGTTFVGRDAASLVDWFGSHPFVSGDTLHYRLPDGTTNTLTLATNDEAAANAISEVRVEHIAATNMKETEFQAQLDLGFAQQGNYRIVDAQGGALSDWASEPAGSTARFTSRPIVRTTDDAYEVFVERRQNQQKRLFQIAFRLTSPEVRSIP